MKVEGKLRIIATLDMSEEEIIQLIAKLENVIQELKDNNN